MSSYEKNNFKDIFESIILIKKPNLIVEFGILNGFSLDCWEKANCKVEAYDIFEKFNGNHSKRNIVDKYKNNPNIKIGELDFYDSYDKFDDNSIDILHVDIANTGDTYKYAVNFFTRKLKSDGIMILEGGSEERDNVGWMKKYNKTPIKKFLTNSCLKYKTINKFPSCTIIPKQNFKKCISDAVVKSITENNIDGLKLAHIDGFVFKDCHLNHAVECGSFNVVNYFLSLGVGNLREAIEWADNIGDVKLLQLLSEFYIKNSLDKKI